MLYVFDDFETLSSKQFNEILDSLPRWRYNKVIKYHNLIDRQLCAMGYILLRDALKNEYGIEDGFDVGFLSNGKPYLKKYPSIHFNLSHCKEAVVCVINNNEIGIDVEAVPQELDIELMNHVMNKEECQYILDSLNPQVEFIKLWTKKESFLKCTAIGLPNNANESKRLNEYFNEFIFEENHIKRDVHKESYIITSCSYI